MLGRRRKSQERGEEDVVTRLFFCTDLHGSDICFRKFLHAGATYEANVVIMGGDCTGKMIIPIVGSDADGWRCDWAGRTVRPAGADELAELEKQIANNGLYPVRMSEEQLADIEADPARLRDLFESVMLGTLRRWTELAAERLADSGL
jgi:hypothetical protein